jgi:Flp pilus assembly protein TadD
VAVAPIIRTCSLGAALLLAAAPAYAQQADFVDYARARAADAAGATLAAAAGYGRALSSAPDDQMLAMRAYRQGIAAGDFALASRAAAALTRAKAAPPDAELLAFAVALKAGDRAAAGAAVARMADGPLGFLSPLLGAWLVQDTGGDSLAVLDKALSNPLGARFAARERPLLLIAQGKRDAATAALAAVGSGADATAARIDAGVALLRTGGNEAPLISGAEAWQARVGKGRVDAGFGAARLFVAIADDIAREKMVPLSVLLARLALLLDPEEDRARLYLGDALSRGGSHDLALATLASVPPDSAFARIAAATHVTALTRAGRTPEALAQAELLARRPDATPAELRAYGDALAAAGRDGDAAAAYGVALGHAAGDWQLHYLQGTALDRAGRWREAEPALRQAIALAPAESEALTYLGYGQVTRGEDLAGAQALLERASTLKPDDAAVTDSLAWAYFTRGDVARALPLLEKAARADPSGARVNEHLGDAYWTLGRHYEARYAWRAAAVTADAGATARLDAKLAHGL